MRRMGGGPPAARAAPMVAVLVVVVLAMWVVAIGATRVAISRSPVYQRGKYTRTEEVTKQCPALTMRETDVFKWGRRSLAARLSFRNGDWEQAEPGALPIIPFLQLNDSALPAKLQLSSFYVTDVSGRRGGQDDRERKVKGMLELVIIDGNSRRRPLFPTDARFEFVRGFSVLSMEVEGVYRQAIGSDQLCLLGCTYLPSPDGGITFSNIQNSTGTRALDKQCSIIVHLSYPLAYNLTSRVIRGTIHSLLRPEDDYSFSPVDISSQVSGGFYRYAGEDLAAKACVADAGSPPVPGGLQAYRPSIGDACAMNMAYLSEGSLLDIEPAWNCTGTAQYCRKIGPFATFETHSSLRVDYNTSRAQILVQGFRNPCTFGMDSGTMPIAFVLRLVPADEAVTLALARSALDGQTLVAEGYWANRSEFTCMVGCKMNDETGRTDVCTARVDLFMPLSLSITQRDVLRGRISSLLPETDPDSFFPLAFHSRLRYHRNLPAEFSSSLQYHYSRLDLAGALLSQYEPESRRHKKSWLTYPSLVGEAAGHYQSLAEDLAFHIKLKDSSGGRGYTYMNFDVVAIDHYLPFVWSGFMGVTNAPTVPTPADDTIVNETDPRWTHRLPEARTYLNCSGTMDLSGGTGNDSFSLTIFTEGYYSPKNGKMYMVGCRIVKASWQDMRERAYDLNRGMDCEIEIVFEYPTTLAAWLSNPGVKVTVHSNRAADDLFHFDDIAAETYPILYRRQRENFASRKSVEGALGILTLSLMVACIVGQLLHVGNNPDAAPFVSLMMLGSQAMGYVIPLVTGAESVLAKNVDYKRDYFLEATGYTRVVLYLDKVLTLVALLLLLRIFEKVWKSRSMLAEENPSAIPPKEHKVAAVFFVLHAVGFCTVMGLRYRNEFSGGVVKEAWGEDLGPTKLLPSNRTLVLAGPAWQVSEEYAGLVEDLFLLPQAIAFSFWDVTGQPLRLSFFVGLTLLQIVPHVYDYVREAGFDIHGYPVFANPNFDFYSNVGNILIPILALLLAVLVYCQQRWKGFLKLPTKFLYERLGSKANETELVTPNGRKQLPSIPEGDE